MSNEEVREMLERIWSEGGDWSKRANEALMQAIDEFEKKERAECMEVKIDISTPALMELMAEECAELAHACLKLSRVMRKENPTPANIGECQQNLVEELADVRLVADRIMNEEWFNETYISLFDWFVKEKTRRWESRVADFSAPLMERR